MSFEDRLSPFHLDGVSVVRGEKKEDQSGSYGYVFEVEIGKVVHIAKKPHTAFLRRVSEGEKKHVISKFREECVLLSKLRHPNIVQFVGVYYGPGGRDDIALVMEKLECDLAAFLGDNRSIDELTKVMILQDVSYGLVYLHEYNPPIIHRDLTARNVLLSQSYQAKIADVGMAKLMDEKAKQAESHTQTPGQMYYMPPEARRKNAVYTSKLDMFSFGHLSLHTVLGDYPVVYEDDITPEVLQEGNAQIMKRQSSLSRIGNQHCLYPSIVKCLMDNPEMRPTAREMNDVLNHLVLERNQHVKYDSLTAENKALKCLLSKANQEMAGITESLQEAVKKSCHLEQLVAEARQALQSQTEELTRTKKQLVENSAQLEQERAALVAMEEENRTLSELVSVHETTASTFEQDFRQERQDREQAHSKFVENEERYKHQLVSLSNETVRVMDELKRQEKLFKDKESEYLARLSQKTNASRERDKKLVDLKEGNKDLEKRNSAVAESKHIHFSTLPARRKTNKSDIISKISDYNLYKISVADKLKTREANGEVIYEGLLKLYWGLEHPITLMPGVRRSYSVRGSGVDYNHVKENVYRPTIKQAESDKTNRELERSSKNLHNTQKSGWDNREQMPKSGGSSDWVEIDDLTSYISEDTSSSSRLSDSLDRQSNGRSRCLSLDSMQEPDEKSLSMPGVTSASARIKREICLRSGKKVIVGGETRHCRRGPGWFISRPLELMRSAYVKEVKMEEKISKVGQEFTPPYGTPTCLRITSIISTKDIIEMLMAKYKVLNSMSEFSLCIIHENGTRELLSSDDCPLQRRLELGPNEDMAKIFVMEAPESMKEKLSQEATSLLSSAAPPLAPVSQRGGLLHTTQDVSLTNSSSIDLDTSEESIPLKIAVIETCNALFKGEKLEGYMVKLSGEVAMSFPSAYLSKISPSLPLKFKVNKKGAELERLLHDRNFLKMTEAECVYCFDMVALVDHLDKLKKKDSKKDHHIVLLKYDVKLDRTKLPLQLKSYMKCEPSVTNFRLDYTYQPSVFSSATKKPTLTKVSFSVPIDGGVQNVRSMPDGVWSAEKESLTWTVDDLHPSDSPVSRQLYARFSLTNGPSFPSKATATFECEDTSLSGLSLDLQGSSYKMDLFKERCEAGKYISEPKI